MACCAILLRLLATAAGAGAAAVLFPTAPNRTAAAPAPTTTGPTTALTAPSPGGAASAGCPPLRPEEVGALTQEQFTARLTEPCRYDKLIRPASARPLEVHVQVDLRHVEVADQLLLRGRMLVQYLFRDGRLRFEHLAPERGHVLGEETLRERIWLPHIIVKNERDSRVMGADKKDVFVSIGPAGDVVYSYRMTANFYCWMRLQKFPFDAQVCALRFSSWTYNSSNLVLHWDRDVPVKVATNLHLTEFSLDGAWTEEEDVPASFSKGAFVGNFSELVFKFRLTREVGYYIMDYYLPSVLLVTISWVSFWLQADAAAPRITLGTSTMLAFITLNGGVTKNLPKVSYIKASEIWFLACACFIFCSMAEFAFVNVIWRRRKKVELKKQSSKHILKGALTPSLARKQLRKAESVNSLHKAHSCSSLTEGERLNSQNNYLTVHGFPTLELPQVKAQSEDALVERYESTISIPVPEAPPPPAGPTWQTMTPQEVANWIDKRSRVVFPVTFVVFNVFYWTFVYIL